MTVGYVTYASAKASHAAVQHDPYAALRCRAAHSRPMCELRDAGPHSCAKLYSDPVGPHTEGASAGDALVPRQRA